jgi:GAF domain-containing protein
MLRLDRAVAAHNVPPVRCRRGPITTTAWQSLARQLELSRRSTPPTPAAQPYVERDPAVVEGVELGGVRTFVAVPMLKDNELIGLIVIYRQEVRPFTDKQVALVTNFASQAVIAIENARLLNELRARTSELTRSVEELRALGEVSQAVNSTLELQTVLDTIVARAAQISAPLRELRLRRAAKNSAERHVRHERRHDRGGATCMPKFPRLSAC